jgi:flagellar biosynthetic protein FlhB
VADKTEAPSARRLEDARKEGQVVRSQELNSAVILLVGAFLLQGLGKNLVSALQSLIANTVTGLAPMDLTEKWLEQTGYNLITTILPPLGLIMIALLLIGVAVTEAQTRFLWASKRIGFDFKRVNPINGFKRIFSLRGLVELLKALLKMVVVGWVAYSYLRGHISDIVNLSQMDLSAGAQQFAALSLNLAIRVGSVYILLAVADYAYQRWDLYRSLKMTKEEVKEEYRRSEGDPLLKGRIRAEMRRMARSRMMSNVPKATVVITNPTHLAIAVQYSDGMGAPKVVAKGAMRVAERIVAIARENSIPVVQNVSLARAIYKTIDIDQEISPDLYKAVAEVLAYVYRLRGRYSVSQRPM